MDEFSRAFSVSGLRPEALQTSYAMAENVFAVTQSGVDGEAAPRRLLVDARTFREQQIAHTSDATPGVIEFVSSGACLPGNTVRIADRTGTDLPEGHVGEILVSSDSLFDGYYNRPDLTEKALVGGWYHSGDLGFFSDGQLYVTGRSKDLIIVSGNNVYPQDIEEIAYGHGSVRDGRAVAFGIWNEKLGTEGIVVVAEVTDAGLLGEAPEIARAVRAAIVTELGVGVRAIYIKPPKWIVKSTAGKPARAASRDKLLAEHPELAGNTVPTER
jgi:acyl-CoA synthetase (AMP-forming)/AMP-acid ligase II